MKKNKGFTLIELLTVIAILAVILLIAAPTILGVLDKAKRSTFKNQVLMYVEGLKTQVALNEIGQEQNITWTNNEATIDFSNINMDSANNYTGKIKVTRDNGKYTYTVIEARGDGWKLKTSKEAKSIIDSDIVKDDGKSTETPTVTYKAYQIGDSVTLKDGTTWHVIEASDSKTETVTLFADQNIKNDASGWTTDMDEYKIVFDEANARTTEKNSYCTNPVYGCNIYAASNEIITNGDLTGTVTEDSTIKKFIDSSVTTYINNSLISAGGTAIKSIRLITTSEICNIINNVDSNNDCTMTNADYDSNGNKKLIEAFTNIPEWLYSTYYWTMTPGLSNSYYVYSMLTTSYFSTGYAHYAGERGVRPVIVTLKSNIK